MAFVTYSFPLIVRKHTVVPIVKGEQLNKLHGPPQWECTHSAGLDFAVIVQVLQLDGPLYSVNAKARQAKYDSFLDF